jgi:hypothetical protein
MKIIAVTTKKYTGPSLKKRDLKNIFQSIDLFFFSASLLKNKKPVVIRKKEMKQSLAT